MLVSRKEQVNERPLVSKQPAQTHSFEAMNLIRRTGHCRRRKNVYLAKLHQKYDRPVQCMETGL